MSHSLPDLGYAYDSLEPHFDARTMEIHHTKHHQAYINNLNAALEAHPELAEKQVCELVSQLGSLPESIQGAVRNNGGGHLNHSFFWEIIKPGGSNQPSGDLAAAIDRDFGSFASFQEAFSKAAMTRFGSGWAWLCVCKEGKLCVCSTANQDNPLMGAAADACAGIPIAGLDVWEHAYYLNYQNLRASYVEAFWNVLNWDSVAQWYEKALKKNAECGDSCGC